jgi:hypothetical protein
MITPGPPNRYDCIVTDGTPLTRTLRTQLMAAVEGQGDCPVVSLLEGGYDVSADTLGLARCVVSHVSALREGPD